MCTFCFVIIGSYEVVMHLKIHVRRQSLFGNFCAECRALFLRLFFRKYCKKYLLLQNDRYFLELMAGLEPATYWLRTVRNPLQPLLYKDFRPFFIPKEWGRTRSVPLFPCVRFPVWVMVWVRQDYAFAPCKNALRNSHHEVVVQSQKSVILFAVSMLHTQKLRRDRQRILTIRPFNNL